MPGIAEAIGKDGQGAASWGEGRTALAVMITQEDMTISLVLNRRAAADFPWLARKDIPSRIERQDLCDAEFLKRTYWTIKDNSRFAGYLTRISLSALGEAEVEFLRRAPKPVMIMLARMSYSPNNGVLSAEDRLVFGIIWSGWPLVVEIEKKGRMRIASVLMPDRGAELRQHDCMEPEHVYGAHDRFRLEYDGLAPVGLLRELFDLRLGERVGQIDECAIVQQWIEAEILPKLADPLVTQAEIEAAEDFLSRAPLTFANGTEEDFSRLIRWILVVDRMKCERVNLVGFHPLVVSSWFRSPDGALQPASDHQQLDHRVFGPGLKRVFDAVTDWMRPQGSAICEWAGPRRSEVVMGPALRYFKRAEAPPSGHEQIEAIEGLQAFLEARGWGEADIKSALWI